MIFEGFEVITDDSLTETKLQMLQPVSRFVEYDESDWWWLLKYGYGKLVQVPSKKSYQMFGNKLVMHSETWKNVKKELDKRQQCFEKYFSL